MAIPTGGQSASDVRSQARQGIIGGRVYSDHTDRVITIVNSTPQAVQVDQTVVDTAANSTLYTVLIAGISVTYTSDASATKVEIAAGLAAAANFDPAVGALLVAASDGVDTVTYTGNFSGQVYTAVDTDANLTTSSVTSAASADAVNFGLAMVSSGFSSSEAYRIGGAAKSTLLTAQVATVDYTYNNTSSLGVKVTDVASGLVYSGEVVQGTSKDASTTALAVQLNAALPAAFVVAANAGAAGYELTLTAELAGVEFAVEVFTDLAQTVLPSVTATTGPSAATSFIRGFAGVSMYTRDEEATVINGSVASYPANAGVKVMDKGHIWVENSETLTYGGVVYVELDGTGDDFGKFYAATSATRLALPQGMAQWERSDITTTDDLAALRVDASHQV